MIDSSKVAALAWAIAIGARMDPASTNLLVRVCCAATRAGWRVPLGERGDHTAVERVSRLLWVAVGDATIVSNDHIAGRAHGAKLLAHLVAHGADADEDELEALILLMEAPGAVVRGDFDADVMRRLSAKITASFEPLLVVHHLDPVAARVAVDVAHGRDVPSLDGIEDLLTVVAGGLLFDRGRNEIRYGERRLSPTPLLWDVLAELARCGPTEASRLGVRAPRERRPSFRQSLHEAFGEDVVLANTARKGAPEVWDLSVAGSGPSPAGIWRFGDNRVDVLRGAPHRAAQKAGLGHVASRARLRRSADSPRRLGRAQRPGATARSHTRPGTEGAARHGADASARARRAGAPQGRPGAAAPGFDRRRALNPSRRGGTTMSRHEQLVLAHAAAAKLADAAGRLCAVARHGRRRRRALATLHTDARMLATRVNALTRTGTRLGHELWTAVGGAAGVLGVLDVLESGTGAADAATALAHVRELAEQVANALAAIDDPSAD
jgi:hypothetical protein